jgi:threonine 3-dehydrogenase
MKCLVKDDLERNGLTLKVDYPEPEPGYNEVRIKVLAASVCGTDKSIYQSAGNRGIQDEMVRYLDRPDQYRPIIIGHEFCGIVESVGEGHDAIQAMGVDRDLVVEPGDYVTAEMHLACGHCTLCRTGNPHICINVRVKGVHLDGCFAESVIVPRKNVILLGKQGDTSAVPPRIGAFLDALGNTFHTVQEAEVNGKSVAILGLGPQGLMATLLARAYGAARIYVTEAVDQEHRFALARDFGADFHFDAIKEREQFYRAVQTQEKASGGVDVVLEMSGSAPAYQDAIGVVRNGGTIVLLGIPRHPLKEFDIAGGVVWKGVTIKGIFGRRMFDTWNTMLNLITSDRFDLTRRLSEMIEPTTYPLDAYEEVFKTLLEGKAMKLIFTPNPDEYAGD